MANEVKGVDRPLKDILATALVSYYLTKSLITNALINGQKKTAKSF